jgi:DNA-binding CsgD family transcriptional regulator
VDLIAKQKKSSEIADILFVSEKTVRNHRYNIIKKLGLPNDNNTLLKWAITNLKEVS